MCLKVFRNGGPFTHRNVSVLPQYHNKNNQDTVSFFPLLEETSAILAT